MDSTPGLTRKARQESSNLTRGLGSLDATMIVIGSMIGHFYRFRRVVSAGWCTRLAARRMGDRWTDDDHRGAVLRRAGSHDAARGRPVRISAGGLWPGHRIPFRLVAPALIQTGTIAAVAIAFANFTGTVLMAIAIMIATFGANNGLILAGARVSYAMARDGLFFQRVGTLNAHHVPAAALITQGVWAAALTLPRTVSVDSQTAAVIYGNVYTQLLEYIIPADLVLYALMVAAVIVMRHKAPAIERPYRTWGYPVVPAIYITLATLLVLDLGYLAPSTSGTGYLLVLTGIPFYLGWRRAVALRSPVVTVFGGDERPQLR